MSNNSPNNSPNNTSFNETNIPSFSPKKPSTTQETDISYTSMQDSPKSTSFPSHYNQPTTHKVFHTIDLLGVEYKCVITTVSIPSGTSPSSDEYWIIHVYPPPKNTDREDSSTTCYELIVRHQEAKVITHNQMSCLALRDLVKESLFQKDSEQAFFRYFFMKPPGVELEDGDNIAQKAKGNRLRAPSSPNDILVFKVVMRSTVGDIAFWLPLKPVFGVFSKFSNDELEQQVKLMEEDILETKNDTEELRQSIKHLQEMNAETKIRLASFEDEKLSILQSLSKLGDASRQSKTSEQNLSNLLKQQQERLQSQAQQILNTQLHGQNEIQELKDMVLKETEKSMRMKLSIASQNEHYAKLMHQVKSTQESLDERLTKIEGVGTEELLENIQLSIKELQEKQTEPQQSQETNKQIEMLTMGMERLEREIERLKSTRPDVMENQDIKKLKQQNDILRKNHLRALQENAAIKLENMELKQMIKSIQDDNKDLQKDLEELLQRDGGAVNHTLIASPDEKNNADDEFNMRGMGDNDLLGDVDDLLDDQPVVNSNYVEDVNQIQLDDPSTKAPNWDQHKMGGELSLSNNNSTVTRVSYDEECWQSVLGENTYFKPGQYSWKIKIDDSATDGDIFIGVADAAEVEVDEKDISGSGRAWSIYCADGEVYHDNQSKPYYEDRLESGDIVVVNLDLENHTLGFSINGKDMGVAFTNVTGPVSPAVSMGSEENYQISFLP